jgi:putative PEP-CTERM system TPR-repeat lipoprotein
MIKKILIVIGIVVVLAGGGAVGWLKYARPSNPFAQAKLLIDKGDFRGAQLELRNAVRDDPSNAEAHFRLGLVQMRLGDPVAAERELRLARDNGFNQRMVMPVLAQTYMAEGKFRELLNDFPTEGLAPELATQILVLRGLAQLQLNALDDAVASFAQAEKLSPTAVEPPLAAARALIVKHDYAAAEAKVDRGLTINARSPEGLLLKAQLFNLRGDRQSALTTLDAAIAASPNMVAARLERANILVALGNDAKARDDVNAVLQIEPRSAGAVYLQAVLAARARDFAAADAGLNKLQAILSRFPRGYYFEAVVKFNLGQVEQAADAADKFMARNPTDPDGVKLVARIDIAAQRAEQAEGVLNRAIANGMSDADVLDLLGRAYMQTGQRDLALANFEKAAALAPDNADILTRLASARLGLGDATGATKDLEHSLELQPKKVDTGETLVVAALASGDIARASEAIAKLKANGTKSEAVGILDGMVKTAALDFDGARATFNEVIKDYPNSVRARLNLAKLAMIQDHPADAEQVLGEILQQEPANEQALAGLVSILTADGRMARAVALVEAAHSAAPANGNVTIMLANLYLRINDPRRALDLLNASQQNQALTLPFAAIRARALIALGQSRDAEDLFRQLLTRNPTDLDARRLLADTLISANNGDAARSVLLDGLKQSPGNAMLIQMLVSSEMKFGTVESALGLVQELARDPQNATALRGLRGDVFMTAKRYAEAANAYAAEFQTKPTSDMLTRLVTADSAAGRNAEARAALTDWLGKNANDIGAQMLLMSLDVSERRYDEALPLLEKIVAETPNNVVALNNLAWILQQKGDPRARDVARKAYLLGPSPQVADTLAWILVSTGDPGTAVPLLRQAYARLPTDPSVTYHLAAALGATGKKEEALDLLRPLVASKTDFDDRPAASKLLDELAGGQ